MNTVGIIAEYNPFHNGHNLHLTKTKNILKNNFTICIMSGNFIQRGLPALYNKWLRTELALNTGIDLVIELPTYYSINSADYFSKYCINLFNKIGVIDAISFGTEHDNISDLYDIANVIIQEPNEYKEELKQQLNNGVTYAKANQLAITKLFNNTKYSNILQNPNNILGIEYIKSIIKTNSQIKPFNIIRTSGYNDETINSNICSASAIRFALENNKKDKLYQVVPKYTYDLINNIPPTFLKDFSSQIIFLLRKMSLKEIENILEVTEGLETRLKKFSFETNNIEELLTLVKTKRFTQAKIQRILIHILLGMTKDEFLEIEKQNLMYIRILGTTSNGKKLIKQIKQNTNIPIITSVKKHIDKYGSNPLLNKDLLSSDIYCGKYNIDMTTKLIIKE